MVMGTARRLITTIRDGLRPSQRQRFEAGVIAEEHSPSQPRSREEIFKDLTRHHPSLLSLGSYSDRPTSSMDMGSLQDMDMHSNIGLPPLEAATQSNEPEGGGGDDDDEFVAAFGPGLSLEEGEVDGSAHNDVRVVASKVNVILPSIR